MSDVGWFFAPIGLGGVVLGALWSDPVAVAGGVLTLLVVLFGESMLS